MRVRRLIAAAACCMITVSGLSACGKQDDPNHIEFMTGMSTGTAQLEAMQQLVDEFEEENPGVTINLIAGTTSYEQDLRVRLALPDRLARVFAEGRRTKLRLAVRF